MQRILQGGGLTKHLLAVSDQLHLAGLRHAGFVGHIQFLAQPGWVGKTAAQQQKEQQKQSIELTTAAFTRQFVVHLQQASRPSVAWTLA
jgi:hypothetical protein